MRWRAAMCTACLASAGIAVLACGACGGSADLPLGGPFGGTLSSSGPYASLDGGADSDGVQTVDNSASGRLNGDSSTAPTWTEIFDAYFAAGKVGNCAHSGCHQSVMTSPSAAFSWLQLQGQVGGASPPLTDPNSSCFSWMGGDMPPDGPDSNPSVEADVDLWAMAGAKND